MSNFQIEHFLPGSRCSLRDALHGAGPERERLAARTLGCRLYSSVDGEGAQAKGWGRGRHEPNSPVRRSTIRGRPRLFRRAGCSLGQCAELSPAYWSAWEPTKIVVPIFARACRELHAGRRTHASISRIMSIE